MKNLFPLVLVTVLALTSCKKEEQNSLSTLRVSETIEAMAGQSNLTVVAGAYEGGKFTEFVSCPVNDGRFSLKLTSSLNSSHLSEEYITGFVPEGVTISNSKVKAVGVSFPVYQGNSYYGDLVCAGASAVVSTNVKYIYGDRSVKIKGTGSYTDNGGVKVYFDCDLSFSKGWNRYAEISKNRSNTEVDLQLTNKIPAGVSWALIQ